MLIKRGYSSPEELSFYPIDRLIQSIPVVGRVQVLEMQFQEGIGGDGVEEALVEGRQEGLEVETVSRQLVIDVLQELSADKGEEEQSA